MICNMNDVCSYFKEVELFCIWCKQHNLHLNVSKTKELIIDFRKRSDCHESIKIEGETVEQVKSYKYLGVLINNKLDWSDHALSITSKINKRMFFVRKLNYFKVDKTLISLFYQSVIQSIISFCVCAWGGNVKAKDIDKITSVIKQASRITGIPQKHFEEIEMECSDKKIIKVLKDPTHPLHTRITFSQRSGRLLLIKAKTERYRKSFIPRAVRHFHDKKKQ